MLVVHYGARQARLRADHLLSTYGPIAARRNQAARFVVRAEDMPADLEIALRAVGREYLAHRFDLLGSGWEVPQYGFRARGFLGRYYEPNGPREPERTGYGLDAVVNRSNLRHACECWSLIRGEQYRPIDWQLDFRAGYRWQSRGHSYHQHILVDTGADIKVPWELGRLQHLPQLALCVVLAAVGRAGFEPPDRYVREIADQLLDFIATNPPRFGVNWMSTMDVAIRAANIALAMALVYGAGQTLSPAIESIVMSSIEDHTRFVASHLDYSEIGRSNHYFCELAGLIWACWILEAGAERDRYLEFAIAEIEKETAVQFLSDGGNYEGSTNYHRLSGEALLFSVGVIRALGRQVPDTIVSTLHKAADLTRAVQGNDGTIVQIGDTDSGRFFKLHPTALPASFGGVTETFVENTLDHTGFVHGVDALFGNVSPGARLEATVVKQLVPEPFRADDVRKGLADYGDIDKIEAEAARPQTTRRVRRLPLAGPVEPATWRRAAFPDFGLYIFRHDGFLVAFRCFSGLDPAAPRGHTHDDNLGLEYRLGTAERRDPGSFVYTPDVARRNAYRAAAAHDVPRPADWAVAPPGQELFELDHRAYATCLAWRPDGVAGEIRMPHGRIVRIVRLTRTELIVTDVFEPPQDFAPIVDLAPARGYGRL